MYFSIHTIFIICIMLLCFTNDTDMVREMKVWKCFSVLVNREIKLNIVLLIMQLYIISLQHCKQQCFGTVVQQKQQWGEMKVKYCNRKSVVLLEVSVFKLTLNNMTHQNIIIHLFLMFCLQNSYISYKYKFHKYKYENRLFFTFALLCTVQQSFAKCEWIIASLGSALKNNLEISNIHWMIKLCFVHPTLYI